MGRPPRKSGDPLVERMDRFANDLIDKAVVSNVKSEDGSEQSGEVIGLQTQLDVFKVVTQWVAIKNKLNEPTGTEGLDELRRKLRNSQAPPRRGAPRKFGRRGDQFAAAAAAAASDGEGGPALDAIRERLPATDFGDDAGAGNDP